MRHLLALIAAVAGASFLTGAAGAAAVPAQTLDFGPGYPGCSAQFVKSNSGIINETNRTASCGDIGGWVSSNLKVQFRPVNGTPNPTCDSAGLIFAIGSYTFTNPPYSAALVSLFGSGVQYNVCFYPVNPVAATGTIDSSAIAGSTATLPSSGTYRIDVSGTYANDGINVADAEYTSIDGWATYQQGYNVVPYLLGEGFGDVQVNGGFVDWGAYNAGHAYGLVGPYSGSINLAVFDGDSNTNTKVPGWYGDNLGSLSYTITYLGL
jgi:hypothetical protein